MAKQRIKTSAWHAKFVFDVTNENSAHVLLPDIADNVYKGLKSRCDEGTVKNHGIWQSAEPDIDYRYKKCDPAKINLDVSFSGQLEAPLGTPTIRGRLVAKLDPALDPKKRSLTIMSMTEPTRDFHDFEKIIHDVLLSHHVWGFVSVGKDKHGIGKPQVCIEINSDRKKCVLFKEKIIYPVKKD